MQKKMRLFLLGDFKSDNGPGMANKSLFRSLKEESGYDLNFSSTENIVLRIFELIYKILKSDITLICSASRINYIALAIIKILKKKTIYIVHGYASYEKALNDPGANNENLKKYEKFIFSNVDKIVCVSKFAMNFIKKDFPEYKHKFAYVYNAISDLAVPNTFLDQNDRGNEKFVMSIGGGMGRKKNNTIAEAVDLLNKKYHIPIKYILIGSDGLYGERLKQNPYVEWHYHLPHEDLMQMMRGSSVYIQNSQFETFGLAPIEALFCGTNVLMSLNMGCCDLFESLEETDIIRDCNDMEEIADKIRSLLETGNNMRLKNLFQEKCISPEYQCKQLGAIISEL